MNEAIKLIAITAALLFLLSACAGLSRTEERVLSGGAIGAGTGAAIGAVTGGSPGTGAAIGGAAGALGGYLYDQTRDEPGRYPHGYYDRDYYDRYDRYDRYPPPRPY
jgi:osmotically inducible lipoprotein OsmB